MASAPARKQPSTRRFSAGAEATGCSVEIAWREPDYLELHTSWPLAERYQANAEFAEHAGAPIGDKAAIDGAKALAMTALDFLLDADLRRRVREEFEKGRRA